MPDRRSRWTQITLLSTAALLACGEPLLQPRNAVVAGKRASQESLTCTSDCVLVDGIAPLREATPLVDSATAVVPVASAEIAGFAGDSIAVKVEADSAVLAGAGPNERLVVRVDGQIRSYGLSQLLGGVVVFRFGASRSVRIRYALTRDVRSHVTSGQFRIRQITDATVSGLSRPQNGGSFGISQFSVTQCSITQSSGNVCGDMISVSPFFAPPVNIGGKFTSNSGTGASNTIIITLSPGVDTVTATIHDPTFSGNEMVAYDSTGAPIGSVSFAFSGTPGDYIEDTETIIAHGIWGIALIPASDDYVSYDVTISAPPCPPSGDPILNQASVRDSLIAAFNRSNPDSAPGTGGRIEHGGVVWQMPDGSFLVQDLTDLAVSNECTNGIVTNPTPPVPGAMRVAEFHTHPTSVNELVYGCQSSSAHYPQFAGDSGVARPPAGDANGGGSNQDWSLAFLHNTPEYIINKDGTVWRLDPNTLQWLRPDNPNHWSWKDPAIPGCFAK